MANKYGKKFNEKASLIPVTANIVFQSPAIVNASELTVLEHYMCDLRSIKETNSTFFSHLSDTAQNVYKELAVLYWKVKMDEGAFTQMIELILLLTHFTLIPINSLIWGYKNPCSLKT